MLSDAFLLADTAIRTWYLLPLLLASSLVFGATRHERVRPILEQAGRFLLSMTTFIAVLYALVWFFSRSL
ncbi:MAG TPA: hypothetical protein VIY86_08565 [Pirellulaceae bacterium]